MNPPLLFPFKTKKNQYIYDTNTNQIVRVHQFLYEKAKKKKNPDYEAIWASIYKKTGVFSNFTPIKIKPFYSKKYITQNLTTTLKQLMLKVTEDCNMSCTYCIYGGSYKGRPVHSTSKMSVETAKKAIDYFFSKQPVERNGREVFIGFYGGEPLLEFELIKNCVNYIATTYNDYTPIYSLTTNATVMKQEHIVFLVHHQFALTVSLDGPEIIHNKNRIFSSQKGTYHIVIQNITKLLMYNTNYAHHFVQLSVTLVPPVDFDVLQDFFSHFPLTKIKTNLVELFGTSYSLKLTDKTHYQSYINLKNRYMEAAVSGKLALQPKPKELVLADAIFGNAMKKIHLRGIFDRLPSHFNAGGMCNPGIDKIMVVPDGSIYVCEKTDGNSNMKLGHITTGINKTKTWQTLQEFYHFLGEQCKSCWFNRLCTVCYAHTVDNHIFNVQKKELNCKVIKKQYEERLILYGEILEQNPHAFDFIDP